MAAGSMAEEDPEAEEPPTATVGATRYEVDVARRKLAKEGKDDEVLRRGRSAPEAGVSDGWFCVVRSAENAGSSAIRGDELGDRTDAGRREREGRESRLRRIGGRSSLGEPVAAPA